MAHIQLLDETLRDGPQSLWGFKMPTGMALPIAPVLDRTGFKAIDYTGSSVFEVLVRYCQEDPWESVDSYVGAMPRTPLRGGMRANACMTFGVSPDALMDIWMRQLNRHGLQSFWIYDTLYNFDKIHRLAKLAKQFGSEVVGTVGYQISPVDTDESFAEQTRRMLASDDIDGLLFYDASGTLDAARLRTLLPKVIEAAGGKPVEFHANNLLGLGGPAYIEAIAHGVRVLHTASRPMANAASVPSTESVVRNLEMLGHTHDIDAGCLPPVAERMERVGRAAGLPVNQFAEYDVLSIHHQIPGGMMGSLLRQLTDHGIKERLPAVLEEVARVRTELGYPPMATPMSQLVGTQAVLNVMTGERYGTVPDQVIQYAIGHYGQPRAAIDPDVLDRIMHSAHAQAVIDNPPPDPTEDELRAQYGTRDDDELILRALVPEADIARMRAAGPVRRDYPLLSSRELEELAEIMKVVANPYVRIATETYELTLAR
jgi:oxaloacetate decarboxylase alpha subunit